MYVREELFKKRREKALHEVGGGVVCEEVDVDVLESQRRAGEAADARTVTVVARPEALGEPDEYRVDERAVRVRAQKSAEACDGDRGRDGEGVGARGQRGAKDGVGEDGRGR